MLKNRVKVSEVLKNQLPQFVSENYPLVPEFLKEYYKSQEIPGGSLDLLNNIDQYVKIDNLVGFSEETILYNSEDPNYVVNVFDDIIYVESVKGFTEKYGLIQINDEIISYESLDKENNAFIGCARGFSGIEFIGNDNELVFTSSLAEIHNSFTVVDGSEVPTAVKNLNILFLKKFLSKIKKQFSPGFDDRNFYEDKDSSIKLNENIFIKQSSDFYSSKGTDNSFKILFRALYGEDISVIKPRDFLFEPSASQYRVTRDLVVEAISGDPLNLVNRTLFQDDSSIYPQSYGSVTNVEKITRDNKDYYIVSLDYDFDKDINVSGSIFGQFPQHPKTLCTDFILQNSTTITVDSTIGFPISGELVVDYEDGEQILISYDTKSLNQFYNCNSVTRDIPLGTEIKYNTNAFCHLNREKTEKVTVRITGVLGEVEINEENNQLYESGDTARINFYGIKDNSVFSNKWIYNIPVTYKIGQEDLISQGFSGGSYKYEILTKDENNIYNNEQIEVDFIFKDETRAEIRTKKIFDAEIGSIPRKSIKITNNYEIIRVFNVRKLITKVKNTSLNPSLTSFDFTANVQNTYLDSSKNLYVTSASLPNYFGENLSIKDRSVTFNGYFSSELIIFRNTNGSLKKHGFITGDAIVYQPGNGDNKLTIDGVGENLKNVYFVKKIDNNSIKLSLSKENLSNNIFLKISGTLTNDENKFTLYNFCDINLNQKVLGTQRLVRTVQNPRESKETVETTPGFLGIFVNGVELLNYKSEDVIYSGKIEDIEVPYGGNDYDVINPPILEVEDPKKLTGSKVTGIVSVEGSLKEIQVLDGGFGYTEEPRVIINGGGGFGAKAKANLVSFDHYIEFNSSPNGNLNLSDNSIILPLDHRFYNGEKVLYDSNGGQNVGTLKNGQFYYVSVVNSKKIKLHDSYSDAINNINVKDLLYSNGVQIIKSPVQKKKIESITISDSGTGYKNNQQTLSPSNVIIETNTLFSKKHGYNSGEILRYNNSGSVIGGLENNKTYYVTKVDDDNFKLSLINENDLDQEFFYRTNQYISFTSIGSGQHIFNYPPITVTVDGSKNIFSTSDQKFDAVVRPIFRGFVKGINITNSGFGYGSDEIINFNKEPDYRLISGSGARVKPIIVNGKIKSVLIENSGMKYNSIPNLTIKGTGLGARLLPILSENGTILEIKVINEGSNYKDDTSINVTNSGQGCKLLFKIQKWTINIVNRLIFNNQISDDDGVLSKPLVEKNDLQYSHAYSPRKLRQYVYSEKIENNEIKYRTDFGNDLSPNNLYHSPIIGWSYDGCPIYGPYGYESPSGGNGGKIIQMKSGYNSYDEDILVEKPNRPSVSNFRLGFFVEDYDYTGNGTLDEFNGRFCKTPEFPDGVYAYFLTISQEVSSENGFIGIKKPIFPYVIGNHFKYDPIEFNFNSKSNQEDIDFSQQLWDRNTYFYNIESKYSDYDFIFNPNKIKNHFTNIVSVKKGGIDNIRVSISGTDYSVGDPLIFDEENNGKLYAEISEIKGKDVIKIESDSFSIANVEFTNLVNSDQIIAFCPYPHNTLNSDKIFINNLNKPITFADSYSITRLQNTLILLNSVQDASVTGIITDFNVFGNLQYPKIKENDIYLIGNEKIKILNIDRNNSKIKVQREYDNTNSSSHNESTILSEESRKIIFTVPGNKNINSSLNDEYYFDPKQSFLLSSGEPAEKTGALFLNLEFLNTQVGIITGPNTILVFNNINDISKFNSGYVDIINSTDSIFNTTKKKIVSVGTTSITIDYNTTSYNGIGVTAYLNKWNYVDIPYNSIYLPNHSLNTNDEIIYNTNSGVGITVFNKIDTIQLQDQTKLYVAKFSDDFVGISTNKVGLGTNGSFVGIGTTISLVYFNTYGEGNNHSFKTMKENTLIGNIISNKATVYTKSNHNLSVNDIVKIDCKPEDEIIVPIEFDPNLKRILVDRKTISPENVNIFTNDIKIISHGYFTGQKVLYKTNGGSIGGLVNNRIYYINVVDFDNIKLSSSYYNATINVPITIDLLSVPTSNTFLYKVNPELNFVKNNKVIFDLSSSTLSYISGANKKPLFDFKLFTDSNFLYEYQGKVKTNNTFDVRKFGDVGISTDARVEIDILNLDKEKLYYKLIPTLNSNQLIYDDYENVDNAYKININNSSFSGEYSIIGINTNGSFSITLKNAPESKSYSNNIKYTTSSKTSVGPIEKVSLKSKSLNLEKLPTIKGISSKNGSGAVLYPESKEIGKINSTKILDIGFNYPIDNTISPKFKFPSILKVEPLSSIDKIDVKFVGNNYVTSPQLLLIDSYTNRVVEDVVLEYDLENRKVIILQNTKGIYNVDPKIIPVNNSNGVSVKFLEYDQTTKKIKATLNVYYDSIDSYPFKIGDKILVEGIVDLKDGTGYNSSNHNYDLFTVTGLQNIFGTLTSIVEYDFNGYGDPGTIDLESTSGSIILEKDFPLFSVFLKKNNFLTGETITSSKGNIGSVESWDSNNELLKIETSDNFEVNEFVTGKSSGSIGQVSNSIFCGGKYKISSTSIVDRGWNNDKGFLNSAFQKIHDSDYYQYFSYSIKSKIGIDKWEDSVDTLNHVSGFKKFGELDIQSRQNNIGISTDQNLIFSDRVNEISEFVDLNCINDFDLVFENNYLIDNNLYSDQIFFNSKELQDYSESRGNRVLLIDDISPLFNSTEREEKYITIDKFSPEFSNSRKYIILVKDKLSDFYRQLNVVTLLQDGKNAYLNQYGNIFTINELGSFDAEIVSGTAELRFYPIKFEFDDYDIVYINYGFNKTLTQTGFVPLGNVVALFGSDTSVTGFASTTVVETDTIYRAVKIINEIEHVQTGSVEYKEFTLLNDGNNLQTLEYGNLSNTTVGFGTYNSYISDDKIKVDFIPSGNYSGELKVRSSVIVISNSTYVGVGTELLLTSDVSSQSVSIASSSSPILNNISYYSDNSSAAYYIVSIEDITNQRYQISEILLVNDNNNCYFVEYGTIQSHESLGTFDSIKTNDGVVLQFEPEPNIDIEIRMLQSTLRLPNRFITNPSLIV